MESLEKELEGLKEEIDDLKKVTHFTSWLLHSLERETESFAFATNAYVRNSPCLPSARLSVKCSGKPLALIICRVHTVNSRHQCTPVRLGFHRLYKVLFVCRHYMASSAIQSTWTERM